MDLAWQVKNHFRLPVSHDGHVPVVPLVESTHRLDIGLIEVGCRPSGKLGQLKEKRQLFLKYWGDSHREDTGWDPTFYKTLVHFTPNRKLQVNQRGYSPDSTVTYHHIPKTALQRITNSEKMELAIFATKTMRDPKQYDHFIDLLFSDDNESLQSLLWNASTNEHDSSQLRGRITEILVKNDVAQVKPNGMKLHWDVNLTYTNKRYRFGTQLDGLVTFHGRDQYTTLLSTLNQLDHVQVECYLN